MTAAAFQNESLTRRVGAITLILLVAGIAFAVFIAPRIEWGDHIRIRVYFHHTGGLREGAPLVAGGQAIGRVEAIGFSPRGAPGPLGGEEGIAVTVAVRAGWARRVLRGGDVFIASRGALSERYLELAPPRDVAAARPLAEGDELLGRDPPTLDRVLERTWNNLTVAREFAGAVRPELDRLRGEIARLAETLLGLAPDLGGADGLLGEVAALRAEARALVEVGLGGDAGLAHLDAVIASARATLARARGVLDGLGAKAGELAAGAGALRDRIGAKAPAAIESARLAIDRLRAAIDRIDPLLAKLAEIHGRIARGEGSLGRLMKDPEFPEDAKELGKIMKRQPWKIIGHPPD
jgi:phospholipid/cholesterol/gamma-HCH transport system substrate-binding protein